ncbi:MAG TPA: aminotransferase class III-fold pyridoxal phosphate-dependent enzyme, partial [Candidatus Cybelea sp.]
VLLRLLRLRSTLARLEAAPGDPLEARHEAFIPERSADALGGAQAREGITPDLTTLGKIIGGGLPVGAFGGRADVMAQLSPDGAVYQAGTLSGNPLAMAAGLATLGIIAADATLYDRLEELTRRLTGGLDDVLTRHGVEHVCNAAGSMFTMYFTSEPVTDLQSARQSDRTLYAKYFGAMLDRGVYFAPSPFEANFLSTAHTTNEIERTVAAADASLSQLVAAPVR